jgi:hypothetical protein
VFFTNKALLFPLLLVFFTSKVIFDKQCCSTAFVGVPHQQRDILKVIIDSQTQYRRNDELQDFEKVKELAYA